MEYNWDKGLWDFPLSFWEADRGCMCLIAFVSPGGLDR